MKTMRHKFVEFIPEALEKGVLYITIEYRTAVHLCICGCGNKVVTPLSPMDWKLTFDGRTVTLYPSIGNWSFDCQSHYFITNNRIKKVRRWSKREIEANREEDVARKQSGFLKKDPETRDERG
jgi:hypothetical protein